MQPIRHVRLGAGGVLVLLAVIVTALIHAVTIVNAQLLATAGRTVGTRRDAFATLPAAVEQVLDRAGRPPDMHGLS